MPANLPKGRLATVGGSPVWKGSGVYHLPISSNASYGISFCTFLPTQRATVLCLRRKTDTTLRAAALFGENTGGNARCGAHAPYNDGVAYWDFGGSASPNRLSAAGLTFSTDIEAWAFVAGSRGSAIYQNGRLVASQSTAITRTGAFDGSSTFYLNQGNSSSADDIELHFFAILDAEWTAEQVKAWTADPYLMFAGTPRSILTAASTTLSVNVADTVTVAEATALTSVRLTSIYAEALTQNASADVRLSGLYAEALTQNATADIRLTSLYTEVLVEPAPPVLTVDVADSVTVTENVNAKVTPLLAAVFETITVGEVTATSLAATGQAADVIAVSDSVTTFVPQCAVHAAEGCTVTDVCTPYLREVVAMTRSATQAISVADVCDREFHDFPRYKTWPTGAVMIAPPSQVHSLGAAISVNGPIWSSEYPLRNLVDGSSDQPCRFAWGTVQITLDLGAAVTPTLVGLLNHNIDTGRVIGITNEQGLNRGFGGRDPNCWIDLRGFPTTARYWTIAINDNTVPVSIGEIVIATMTEFRHGLWEGEPGFTERLVYPGFRETTEYLKAYISTSGALIRTSEPQVRVNDDDWLQLEAIATEVLAVTGRRVLVVPSSRINDVWFCDWPTTEEVVYENPMERTLRLTLLEVVGSVLNGR